MIQETESPVSEKDRLGWHETTVVVLTGITNLLANYLNVLSQHYSFRDSWETLLGHLRALLGFEVLDINTAVFKSLRHILSKVNAKGSGLTDFDPFVIDSAWSLWSESLPIVTPERPDRQFNNQEYLLAYVCTLPEIYRLVESELDGDRVRRMLTLLRQAIQQASAAGYTADIDYLTPLQTQVLESIKMIRTDIDGIPAALIGQVAEFIALAFEPRVPPVEGQRPTYVALSKASMILSESLILAHSSNRDICNSGAVSASISALSKPILLKYRFSIITKTISPWRQATTSALTILKSIIPVITKEDLAENVIRSIWSSIVTIANGISKAHCQDVPETIDIKYDQEFDIASFLTLRELIIPALGSQTIPDKTRRSYTESLFHTSLIHQPQPQELPQVNQELLATLYHPRKGRTTDPTPCLRSEMSYVCFDELMSLVSIHDSSEPRIKLAQAAAPYLILRAGLTLRAYIADQPLRGRMPQPLSQRRELLYILEALVRMRCEPDAIPDMPGAESEGKKHLHRLYPLLAKTARAAAHDQEVLEWNGKALDEVGMEFGF
jgi:hypothetical protein